MIEKIKIKVLKSIESLGFERKVLVNAKILDKNFLVRKGTIRNKPDKDDAWLFELSKKSKTIFDVGSNIGQSSILMSYNNPEKIILIDPNPRALCVAAENIILNNISQKTIFYNCFVGENSGEIIDFYTVGLGAAGSKFKSFAKSANRIGSHFKVKTKTIDEISKETKITPELIKIDVEGAESEVLIGSTSLARKQITKFFVEVHSGAELSITENTSKILKWCNENNYKAIYLKTMNNLNIENISKRGRYHALLMPENENIPNNLSKIKEGDKINYS